MTLAREFSVDHVSLTSMIRGGWVEKTDTTGITDLAYISEMMGKGTTAPVEYCAPSIRDIIISVRKQTLITGLEQDLLNDARKTGKLVIMD